MKPTIYIKLSGHHDTRAVWLNGELLDPKPSQELKSHSPDGFAWGYGGSGPAQLALAICIELYGETKALRVYQEFKGKYIAGLAQKDFTTRFQVKIEEDGYMEL